MNLLQHLLIKLTEEAAEVQQIALKSAQFGFQSSHPSETKTNIERCHAVLNDLNAIVQLLNEEHGFSYIPNPAEIEKKKLKVKEYLQYSIDLGFVTPEV